jgi:proline iminopeptidase
MYAHVNGVDIFFDIEGPGYTPDGPTMRAKPTLFVLHGGPGADYTSFRPWLDPLAGDVQLVFLDHRGNGRSSRAALQTYSIEQMADDVEALRHYLGLGPIAVLGHSFGGMVAQVLALRHPRSLSHLILSGTAPSARFWDEAQAEAARIATGEQQEVLSSLFEGRITSQEEWDSWWVRCFPLYFRTADPAAMADISGRTIGAFEVGSYMMAHEIPHYDVRSELATITVPTLVVVGRHDWVTPVSQSAQIAESIPGSRLVVLEGSGHLGYVEEQQAYLEAVRGFMTGRP